MTLPTMRRDGFAGEPVEVDPANVVWVRPSACDGEGFFNVAKPVCLVRLRDGQTVRVALTKQKLQQRLGIPDILSTHR